MKFPNLLTIIIFFAFTKCSDNSQTEEAKYAPIGTILTYDTMTKKYVIAKHDIKLIKTWALFKQDISKNGFEALKQLSTDSIVCPNCGIQNEKYNITIIDTFCKNFAPDIFSKSFLNLMFDSSKIRCNYSYDSSYFYTYQYLTTISNLDRPKIAQIFVSFPLRSGEAEGTTAILGFIETKTSYKFFGYSTIP